MSGSWIGWWVTSWFIPVKTNCASSSGDEFSLKILHTLDWSNNVLSWPFVQYSLRMLVMRDLIPHGHIPTWVESSRFKGIFSDSGLCGDVTLQAVCSNSLCCMCRWLHPDLLEDHKGRDIIFWDQLTLWLLGCPVVSWYMNPSSHPHLCELWLCLWHHRQLLWLPLKY